MSTKISAVLAIGIWLLLSISPSLLAFGDIACSVACKNNFCPVSKGAHTGHEEKQLPSCHRPAQSDCKLTAKCNHDLQGLVFTFDGILPDQDRSPDILIRGISSHAHSAPGASMLTIESPPPRLLS